MNNYAIAVDIIKNNISALDVGKTIGLNIDNHGRCPCPFHNGKDRNMKLFTGNRGYSCFVCHNSGDVISFVRQYYSMSFKDCVAWFNDTFRLGLDIESPMSQDELKRAENARKMRERERAFHEWKDYARFRLALDADEIVGKLEEQREQHMPKTPYEAWDEKFCEAVEALPEARRFADDCMMNCMKGKA